MDRYMKVVFTVIAIALVSLAVKDVDLFPIAEAQQGWEIDNEIAMMNGSMQALPESADYGYICRSILIPGTNSLGDHGSLNVVFHTAPQCMGLHLGSAYMFSDGATSSHSVSDYLLSENQLLSYFESTNQAAENGQRVMYQRCADDKTSCLRYIAFRGDPADVAAD